MNNVPIVNVTKRKVGLPISDLHSVIEKMREVIIVKDVKHDLFKTYKNCFKGSDAMQWLQLYFNINEKLATMIGLELITQKFIVPVMAEQIFPMHYYRFTCKKLLNVPDDVHFDAKDTAPNDVLLERILKSDSVTRRTFVNYYNENINQYCLVLYFEASFYKQIYSTSSKGDMLLLAKHIYNSYLSNESPRHTTVDADVVTNVKTIISSKNVPLELFDGVQKYLFQQVLTHIFPKYRQYTLELQEKIAYDSIVYMIDLRIVEARHLQAKEFEGSEVYFTVEVVNNDPIIDEDLVNTKEEDDDEIIALEEKKKTEAEEIEKVHDASLTSSKCTGPYFWNDEITVHCRGIDLQHVQVHFYQSRALKNSYLGSIPIDLTEIFMKYSSDQIKYAMKRNSITTSSNNTTQSEKEEGSVLNIDEIKVFSCEDWFRLKNKKRRQHFIASGYAYACMHITKLDKAYTREFIELPAFKRKRKKRLYLSPLHPKRSLEPKLKVWTGTWNLGNTGPPHDLTSWIDINNDYDIIAVSVQECLYDPPIIQYGNTNKCVFSDCTTDWVACLIKQMGPKYYLIGSTTLRAIRIHVFVRSTYADLVDAVDTHKVATGIGNVYGNKGAAAISFGLFHTSFCFVCCHLAAHQDKTMARNDDAQLIFKSLRLGHMSNRQDVTTQFDYLFFMGDMNYRLNFGENHKRVPSIANFNYILDHVNNNNFKPMLEIDQLRYEQKVGRALELFQEGDINFRPTFKVYMDSTILRYKKSRAPAWCDRVLHMPCAKSGANLKQLEYSSVEDIITSDHKPVFATYELLAWKLAPAVDDTWGECQVSLTNIQFTSKRTAYAPDSVISLSITSESFRSPGFVDISLLVDTNCSTNYTNSLWKGKLDDTLFLVTNNPHRVHKSKIYIKIIKKPEVIGYGVDALKIDDSDIIHNIKVDQLIKYGYTFTSTTILQAEALQVGTLSLTWSVKWNDKALLQ